MPVLSYIYCIFKVYTCIRIIYSFILFSHHVISLSNRRSPFNRLSNEPKAFFETIPLSKWIVAAPAFALTAPAFLLARWTTCSFLHAFLHLSLLEARSRRWWKRRGDGLFRTFYPWRRETYTWRISPPDHGAPLGFFNVTVFSHSIFIQTPNSCGYIDPNWIK